VRDELLEDDAQATEDVSAFVKVRAALLERDEALQKARENAAAMRTVTEVASIRAQLEQGCATLEGTRSWKSQAEERAKEAEQLRTGLADKAASLASMRSNFNGSGTRFDRRTLSFSRSRPPLLRLRPLLSTSILRWKRPRADSSRSAPHSRGCRQPSSSETRKSRGSTGS
jgi:hypothetical protein